MVEKTNECSRPVECGNCKKPITCIYKEIASELILCSERCSECPVLEEKLYGRSNAAIKKLGPTETEMGLYCGNCRTSLESVKMGNPLGCAECYAIFSDVLISELIGTDKIPSRLKKTLLTKKNQPIHIGTTPHKPAENAPSSRLTGLNEALNEALKRENYEQAAWLRDQIKALTEKTDEGKN